MGSLDFFLSLWSIFDDITQASLRIYATVYSKVQQNKFICLYATVSNDIQMYFRCYNELRINVK